MVKKKKYIEPMAKSWVEDATKLIKFKDDRLRVQAELLDHIEDAADAWKDAGYDDYEAKKKAVSNMGDAAEVANNLADIYRPFWGRLWKLTKWLRNFAIIYAVFFISRYLFYDYIRVYEFRAITDHPTGRIISKYESDTEIKVGGYKITLGEVEVAYEATTGETPKAITMEVPMNVFTVFKNRYSPLDFEIKDDLGNKFYSNWSPADMANLGWMSEDEYMEKYEKYLYKLVDTYNYHWKGNTDYLLILEGIPVDAKEIIVSYDHFGHSYSFTLPVYGGVGNER